MTGLLRLLKEGRAWSVEELAGRLETSQEDIRRQVEYLEHTGFLRRLDSMGRCAAGRGSACGSGCTRGLGMSGMPVMWEVIANLSTRRFREYTIAKRRMHCYNNTELKSDAAVFSSL